MKKLSLSLVLIAMMFTGCYNVGEGSKIGQVTKVNTASGLFCKTVEVEIIRGGFNSGSGAQGTKLDFTVENNPQAVETLTKAMESGQEVEIEYHKELASLCRSDSESVFGDSVKVIGQSDDNATVIPVKDKRTELIRAVMIQSKALELQNKALQKVLEEK